LGDVQALRDAPKDTAREIRLALHAQRKIRQADVGADRLNSGKSYAVFHYELVRIADNRQLATVRQRNRDSDAVCDRARGRKTKKRG
jgi:hypothetical protein